MPGDKNPWEKALMLAGAADAPSLTMRANMQRIQEQKCLRCSGPMTKVRLSASSDRMVLYCEKDRVTLPLPVGV